VGTVFDDEAATNITDGGAPYTGSFRPQNDQLSRFDGKRQEGTWTLRVRDLFEGVTGTLGGWGTETRRAVCDFDDAAPDTTIEANPPNPSASDRATFGFSSPEDGAGFECRLDGRPYTECGSSQSYSGLADGSHTFFVRAVDGTGNVDPTPASYTWLVDTPADTTITSGPSGLVNTRNATFGFASDEPSVTLECRLDGGGFVACGSPATFSELADGGHALEVRARDPTGQVDDTPARATWSIDATAPTLSITSPRAGDALLDPSPTIAGTAGTAGGDAGVVTVRILSGRAAAGVPLQTLTVPREVSSGAWSSDAACLGDGTYTVRAEQTDSAGNTGVSPPVTFAVDTTAPEVALAPREEYLSDVLRRGLTVLAGCSSTCSVSATLTVPTARARTLGLRLPRGRASLRTVRLAGRTVQFGPGDYRALTLQLSHAAKAALATRPR
jgi:Bacterial Ig-like domain